ncbi:MAG: cupin domain-containing protein [Gammaproteobacteria bacterium]
MSNIENKFRRIVTGHNAQGRAVFRSINTLEPIMIASGDAAMATIWTTGELPIDLNDETDGLDRDPGLTLKGGSVIRICDMLPGGESPMHRTNSLDYGIVISGEVELELDDGVIEVCKQGDVIVQRGTVHLWRNTTNEPCRIVFILTESKGPYLQNGSPLPEIKP